MKWDCPITSKALLLILLSCGTFDQQHRGTHTLWCALSIISQVEQSGTETAGSVVFRWTDPVTGFIRFRPEPTGTCQNRQPDTVTGFLRRIPGIFRPETASFLRVFAGNSWDTASGIIVLGPISIQGVVDLKKQPFDCSSHLHHGYS
jgi:hypothetical protein